MADNMELLRALIKARKSFKSVPKAHTADAGKYKYSYASLEDIMAMVEKPLSDNGLVLVHETTREECITKLYHESGESISASLPIRGATPQTLGAELSYMRRYGVSALLAIVTEDDDDGQRAESEATTRNRAQAASGGRRRAQPDEEVDGKARALKAFWAAARAMGGAIGEDEPGVERLVREYLAEEFSVKSTRVLTEAQLKHARAYFSKIEKENSPNG